VKRPLRTLVKWFMSLVIGGLFVWLALEEWPLEDLLAGGLRVDGLVMSTDTWSVNLLYFPAYFVTLVCMHIFRVWRWKPLLRPLADVDFWTLNRACSVGFMAVFLLPMRVGEFVRPAVLSLEAPVRRSAGLATIVVERLVDGVMVAGFLSVALVFMPRGESFTEIRIGTYVALAAFGGTGLTLAVLFAFRRRVIPLIRRMLDRLSSRNVSRNLTGLVERFLNGLSILPDVRNLLWFLALSFFYWISNGLGLFLLSVAFGLNVPVLGAFAMMSTIVVGMMIPNAPANVGSFWYFLLKPTELYGVAPGSPAALAFALAVWLIQLVQLTVFGAYFLVRGQVSMRRAFAVSWEKEN
jgi:uncharacterized protein (TIRG00374 family)